MAVVAAQPRPLNGDLLSIDDEEALLAAPAVGLLGLAPLLVLASELAHFVVHDELHQLQACLAHQLADALLQGGGDFFERQVQLQFLPGFFDLLVELANGLFCPASAGNGEQRSAVKLTEGTHEKKHESTTQPKRRSPF